MLCRRLGKSVALIQRKSKRHNKKSIITAHDNVTSLTKYFFIRTPALFERERIFPSAWFGKYNSEFVITQFRTIPNNFELEIRSLLTKVVSDFGGKSSPIGVPLVNGRDVNVVFSQRRHLFTQKTTKLSHIHVKITLSY